LSIVVPLGEAPDEPAHWDYVRYLVRTGALPVMRPRLEENETVEAFQAPGYYALAALTAWPFADEETRLGLNPAFSFTSQGPPVPTFYSLPEHSFPWQGAYLGWHITRLLSLGLGAATLWVTYRAGRLVSQSLWLAVAAVGYLALNPQFIYLHSVVTNDALATLSGGLLCLAAVSLLGRPKVRQFVWAGLAIALAVLSKPSALLLGPGLAAAAVVAWGRLGSKRERWLALVALVLIPLACSSWWFLRNLRLYGDWMGMNAAKQALSKNYYAEPVSLSHLFSLLPAMLEQTFKSTFGIFGWLSYPLPRWVYWCILVVHGVAVIGLVIRPRSLWRRRVVAIVLAAMWLGLALGFLYYNRETNTSGWHGRFLFPGLPALALVFAAGCKQLAGRQKTILGGLLSVGGLALVAIALSQVILPAYLPPRTLSVHAALPSRLDVEFEGGLRLVGYSLPAPKVASGADLPVTLYWQVQPGLSKPYRFVFGGHTLEGAALLSFAESLLPLRCPVGVWPTDRIVVDHTRLPVVPDVSQAVGQLYVQVYRGYKDAQAVPIVDQEGTKVGLGQVAVGPERQSWRRSRSALASFGDHEINLLGCDLDPPVVRAGEVLSVTLHWQAQRQPAKSYQVFVHLVDADGQLVAQQDGPPRMGSYPTLVWSPNEAVLDVHPVPIPAGYEGALRPFVGFYALDSMERLPVVDAEGIQHPNHALPLAEVEVRFGAAQ
jgi:4-amino-4-deoxy-L-arabinose transferase-like glycosyltransferase